MERKFICIKNKEQNKLVQKILFKLGYKWQSGSIQVMSFDEYPVCLNLNYATDYRITFRLAITSKSDCYKTFDKKITELTLKELVEEYMKVEHDFVSEREINLFFENLMLKNKVEELENKLKEYNPTEVEKAWEALNGMYNIDPSVETVDGVQEFNVYFHHPVSFSYVADLAEELYSSELDASKIGIYPSGNKDDNTYVIIRSR